MTPTRQPTQTCNTPRPGDGHPRYGIPHCTLPADHIHASEHIGRMHSAPVGPDGWSRWGDNYRP